MLLAQRCDLLFSYQRSGYLIPSNCQLIQNLRRLLERAQLVIRIYGVLGATRPVYLFSLFIILTAIMQNLINN